jgi:hypothetical protein
MNKYAVAATPKSNRRRIMKKVGAWNEINRLTDFNVVSMFTISSLRRVEFVFWAAEILRPFFSEWHLSVKARMYFDLN